MTKRSSTPTRWVMPPAAARSYSSLMQAVADLEDAGQSTPCRNDPEPFTADYIAVRSMATDMCQDCPLVDVCAAYAKTAREKWGVWGGTDRSQHDPYVPSRLEN